MTMRYVEQSNIVYLLAKDGEKAKEMIDRLRIEYFTDYISNKRDATARQVAALMDMQSKSYNMVTGGGRLVLEIKDAK